MVLDVSTSRYHLPDFFSVSPSSNPLFCPVSLSIKSPLPVEIFFTTECLLNTMVSLSPLSSGLDSSLFIQGMLVKQVLQG